MASSPPEDSPEALADERIRAARDAVDNPQEGVTDAALRLTDEERDAIRQALQRSTRPIVGFTDRLLDIYDELGDRDRSDALDLFANLVNHPHQRSHNVATDREPRGAER